MNHRAPHLSLPSRWLGRLVDGAGEMPIGLAWAAAVSASVLVLSLDMLVGQFYNGGIVHLMLFALLATCLPERSAMGVALLFGIGSAWVQHLQITLHHVPEARYGSPWIDGAARITWSCLLMALFNAMRGWIALERWRARIDMLTGVLNKGAFEVAMAGKIREARAVGGALVLAYMDLDGFKSVNDRYGHSAGDRVLRAFAAAACDAIRSNDLFARFGGDEFAALMVVPSIAAGDHVAAMVHGRLSAILAETGTGVTCSTGALVMDARQLEMADSYVELADKLMYEAKQAGKNALRLGRVDAIGAVLRSVFPPVAGPFEMPAPPAPCLVVDASRHAA